MFSDETRRFYLETIGGLDVDAVAFACTEIGLLLEPDDVAVPRVRHRAHARGGARRLRAELGVTAEARVERPPVAERDCAVAQRRDIRVVLQPIRR